MSNSLTSKGLGTFGIKVIEKEVSELTPPLTLPFKVNVNTASSEKPESSLIANRLVKVSKVKIGKVGFG